MTENEENLEEPRPLTAKKRRLLFTSAAAILVFSIIIFATLFYVASAPSKHYSSPLIIEVKQGMTVSEIATLVKREKLVRSELLFYSIITAIHDPTNIHAGRYIFEKPVSTFEVAEKFANNEIDELLIKLTIPEGVTTKKIASLAAAVLPEFDEQLYVELTKNNEGFYFPETYLVPESFTAQQLIDLQSKTFVDNIRPLEYLTASSTLQSTDIVNLASIVEREANDEESMKIVAGILLNRLEIGMALQADATIEYVLDQPLNKLKPGELAKNLRELDSPYNSYKYAGLPPTPIGNPGLMAIKAVIQPEVTDYFFYITDTEGDFHYAETLNQHNRNVDMYLR